MNRILFIPSVLRGRGTGHLARCAAWSKRLPGSALSLHETDSPDTFPSGTVRNRYGLVDGSTVMRIEPDRWDAAVLDRFATSLRELAGMGLEMPVIGIDEGGGARVSLSYLIDTLPGGDGTANVSGLGFLDLPERAKDFPEKRERVIVCFGGEDRAGLTSAVARLLVSSGRAEPENVLAVRGALADPATLPAGIRASGPVEDLKSRLHDFDLVVTSFGLTAFEAIAAGTPVILVNPTSYHDRLAGLSGIPFARRGLGWERRFLELFDDAGSVSRACAAIDIGPRIDMPGFLAELDAARDSGCPACRSLKRSALLRDRERSFFRCGTCGITYEILFGADPTGYGREYFVEEYRNQYGRTYLEDFDVIRAMASERLAIMRSISRSIESTLLDVGCAYGPFLVESAVAGYRAFGIDISADAVEHVTRTLGIPAVTGDYEDFDGTAAFSIPRFDVVTMWYVIEHFRDLDAVLAKTARLVVPGGLFCFSTPNLSGISGIRNLRRFLSASPKDHYTVLSPRTVRRLLGRYGFAVRRIRITGHHPERFPGGGGALRPIFSAVSRLFGLGDTFETYAVRVGEPDDR